MAKKRTTRRVARSPRGHRARSEPRALTYKVVELATVDEATLEHAINEWVALGWRLDGVQFAMRESSKRPSMAFVLFTREGPARIDANPRGRLQASLESTAAASSPTAPATVPDASGNDPWARLEALAAEAEDSP
jgi:hypothetical protein